jgi:hypothetical protein
MDLELVWSNHMDSGVYSTPIIYPLFSGGTKQVIIPTFHRDLDILDNHGHKLPGWPFNIGEGQHFHSSPVLYDYDRDGQLDIILISVNAQVFIVRFGPPFLLLVFFVCVCLASPLRLFLSPMLIFQRRSHQWWNTAAQALLFPQTQAS